MRRKHLRLLANLTRFLPLGICVTAATTATVWYGYPQLVDRLEVWLLARHHDAHEQQWRAIRQEKDPELARQQLEALIDSLGDVRRMDYQARIFSDCLLRLSQLAERQGNLDEAIAWMERSVQFNENDLHTKTRLSDLLCRREATRADGLELLRALHEMVPGNQVVAPALVRNLAKAGALAEAAEVVAIADAVPESNFWHMRWGVDTQKQLSPRVGVLEQQVGSEVQLQVEFEDAVGTLELRPSPYHSATLLNPRLSVEHDGVRTSLDLSDPQVATVTNILQQPGRLTTYSHGAPQIVINLPEPAPAHSLITLSAEVVDLPCAVLANEVRSPALEPFFDEETQVSAELQETMRQIRRLATSTDSLQVHWRGPDQAAFDKSRSAKTVMGSLPTASGVEFAAQLPVSSTGSMDHLRIDFPAGKGISYRIDTLTIACESGDVSIDASTVDIESAHSLERSDGWFTTTGPKPHFVFALPRPLDGVTGIQIGGFVR